MLTVTLLCFSLLCVLSFLSELCEIKYSFFVCLAICNVLLWSRNFVILYSYQFFINYIWLSRRVLRTCSFPSHQKSHSTLPPATKARARGGNAIAKNLGWASNLFFSWFQCSHHLTIVHFLIFCFHSSKHAQACLLRQFFFFFLFLNKISSLPCKMFLRFQADNMELFNWRLTEAEVHKWVHKHLKQKCSWVAKVVVVMAEISCCFSQCW